MKYLSVFTLLLLSTLSFSQEIKAFDPDSFQKALREDNNAQLVDLRSADDFNEGHIKRAVSLDYISDDFSESALAVLDKNRALFLYSFTGKEAQNASIFLKDLGFKEVYFLEGGFSKWTASSKPYISSRTTTRPIAPFTVENLEQTVKSNQNVFVFLYSPICKECKSLEAIIRNNTGIQKGIKLVKLDMTKEPTIAEHFNTSEAPTLIYFQNGRQTWKYKGVISEKDLQAVLLKTSR